MSDVQIVKAKNVDKFKNLIDQKLFNLKYKLYKYD